MLCSSLSSFLSGWARRRRRRRRRRKVRLGNLGDWMGKEEEEEVFLLSLWCDPIRKEGVGREGMDGMV